MSSVMGRDIKWQGGKRGRDFLVFNGKVPMRQGLAGTCYSPHRNLLCFSTDVRPAARQGLRQGIWIRAQYCICLA